MSGQSITDYYLVNYCNATSDAGRKTELANDASAVLQRMFIAIASQGVLGPTVHLPPWEMKLVSTVDQWVASTILQGEGANELPIAGKDQSRFYRDDPNFVPFNLTINLSGGGFRDILFYENQPDRNASTFSAIDYQPWIISTSAGHEFRRLNFFNSSRWLKFGDGEKGSGRMFVRDVTGQPLVRGIDIENTADTIRIHGVHMWPYFAYTPSVRTYCQANAIGIRSARNDGCVLQDIFIGGCYRGIQIDEIEFENEGSPYKVSTTGIQASDVDIDFTRVGIFVNASTSKVNCFSNLRIQPGPDSPFTDSRAIEFAPSSNNCDLFISNMVCDRTVLESIYIPGTDNTLSLSNPRLGTWDDNNSGQYYCINVASGNYVKISNPTFISSNGRYYTGGATWSGIYTTGSGTFTADASGNITIPLNLGGLTPSHFSYEIVNEYPFVLTRGQVAPDTYVARVWSPNTLTTPAGSVVVLTFSAYV